MESVDHRSMIAVILVVAALGDLALIPILRTRVHGTSQPIIMLAMLSSSLLMMGLAAALWFGLLPLG